MKTLTKKQLKALKKQATTMLAKFWLIAAPVGFLSGVLLSKFILGPCEMLGSNIIPIISLPLGLFIFPWFILYRYGQDAAEIVINLEEDKNE